MWVLFIWIKGEATSCDELLFPMITTVCFWVTSSLILQVLSLYRCSLREGVSHLNTHHISLPFYEGFCSLWQNRSETSFEMTHWNTTQRGREPSHLTVTDIESPSSFVWTAVRLPCSLYAPPALLPSPFLSSAAMTFRGLKLDQIILSLKDSPVVSHCP